MYVYKQQQRIYHTLRIASAMCFIGHGAFGIITKSIWCNYFAVFGIPHDTAYRLMPILGSFDILLGIGMLLYPLRVIPAWLLVWGIVTALLRPLSGEPFAEFLERAGNFGAPLVLLLLSGKANGWRDWFTPLRPGKAIDAKTFERVAWSLRIIVFLLLLGHGWLNILEKKGLLAEYASLGFSNPLGVARTVGILEIAAACAVLIRPFGPFILLLLFWKMGTEFFYPHWELFEWIERGGSYGALLALWFISSAPIPTPNLRGRESLPIRPH
ncbi:MAG TPA: hypothetical protein VGM41_01235 [Chitinophagaceae bacterium]